MHPVNSVEIQGSRKTLEMLITRRGIEWTSQLLFPGEVPSLSHESGLRLEDSVLIGMLDLRKSI
jgi:hypothetical protein